MEETQVIELDLNLVGIPTVYRVDIQFVICKLFYKLSKKILNTKFNKSLTNLIKSRCIIMDEISLGIISSKYRIEIPIQLINFKFVSINLILSKY